ncbi:MAG: hypothetical protein OXI46_05910 [Gemmatimonadota bacterium]|nr:hypothetical protein [Gemmatimonadota bacterium]
MTRALSLATLTVALAGCGEGNGIGPDRRGLDQAEVVELVETIMEAGFEVTPEPRPEVTVRCPLGGWATATSTLTTRGDPQEPSGVSLSTVLRHEACAAGIFTLNGAPGLTFMLDLDATTLPALQVTGTVTGSVRWRTTDGRDGTCALDLDLAVQEISPQAIGDPPPPPGAILSGRACSEDITLSVL